MQGKIKAIGRITGYTKATQNENRTTAANLFREAFNKTCYKITVTDMRKQVHRYLLPTLFTVSIHSLHKDNIAFLFFIIDN